MTASSLSKRARKPKRPKKPYPEFPLTAHASGKWCKKVRGQTYYFGTWSDPDGALNEWLDRQDGIRAGRDGEEYETTGDDVAALCNEFLAAKLQQLEDGDIEKGTYDKYETTCDRFVQHFGKGRALDSIDAPDFRKFRASWPKTWGASSINNEIARVKACLNFGFESGVVDKPFRTGPNFKRVSKKKQRLERAKKPKKLFSAEEIHKLIEVADVQMKAMILLGINAGYGNADCGRLTISSIDFERRWLEGLRHKTAVERAAWLWPETVRAVKAAIDQRYQNAPEALADHVFITKRRQAWFRATGKDDAIGQAFRKLQDKTGCYRQGVGFYSLRHTFETVAGNSKDQVAVNFVMGHVDDSMAAVYREGIDEQRIYDVCKFVRRWFRDGKPKRKPKRSATK